MKTKKTKAGVDISSTYGMKTVKTRPVWVVVAHRAGAQIYETKGETFKEVQVFPFPEGKAKESRLVSDRPGRSFDSWSRSTGGHLTGNPRHAMSSKESPADHAMVVFSERIADFLDSSRKENKFSKFVLVAEPRLMGRLKSCLNRQTSKLIALRREKDYSWLKKPALKNRLHSLL